MSYPNALYLGHIHCHGKPLTHLRQKWSLPIHMPDKTQEGQAEQHRNRTLQPWLLHLRN